MDAEMRAAEEARCISSALRCVETAYARLYRAAYLETDTARRDEIVRLADELFDLHRRIRALREQFLHR